jgi:uncharacterized protein (TIGR04255 family)
MGKKYAKPPVIEAVCEFRLSPATKWDPAVPGLIYSRVKEDFPNREQRQIREIEMSEMPDGTQQQVRTSEVAVFLSHDRKAFIQVGPRLLAINCLKPYPSWERFRPNIVRAFEALGDTVAIQALERIGLLYINRIEITGQSADLDKYFEFRPYLGPGLPQHMSSLLLGCLLPFNEGKEVCRVELVTLTPDKPNTVVLLLRLDYSLSQPNVLPPERALDWVDVAHSHIEDIFEGCISDRLREIFSEVK